MQRHFAVIAAIGIALAFPLFLLLVATVGCDTAQGHAPYPLSPQLEFTITNAAAAAQAAAAAMPKSPVSIAIETLAAVVLALLACWQGFTHNKLKVLQNGTPKPKEKESP